MCILYRYQKRVLAHAPPGTTYIECQDLIVCLNPISYAGSKRDDGLAQPVKNSFPCWHRFAQLLKCTLVMAIEL